MPRYRPGPAPLAPSRGGARSPWPLRDESPVRIPSPVISMAWPGILPGLLRASLSARGLRLGRRLRVAPCLSFPFGPCGPRPARQRVPGPAAPSARPGIPPARSSPRVFKPFPVFSLPAGPAGRGCAPRPALEACVRAHAGVIPLTGPTFCSGPLGPKPRRHVRRAPRLRFVFPLVPGGASGRRRHCPCHPDARTSRGSPWCLFSPRVAGDLGRATRGVGPLSMFLVWGREFPSGRRLRSRRLGARLPLPSSCFGRKVFPVVADSCRAYLSDRLSKPGGR